jgi:hypothetical protein
MIIRNCTTTQILFDYLVGRRKTEDGRIPSFDFFEIFLKLYRPSGKKADIHVKFLKYSLTLIVLAISMFSCTAQENVPFQEVPNSFPTLRKVLEDPETYKVQILYTEINRDSENRVSFKDFSFNLDDEVYFYPASTVKLPVAVLALEWLGEQGLEGINAYTTMQTDSVRSSQLPALHDSSAIDLKPSIAHYIKKILLVSDNDAYNRLYELLGQDYINTKLWNKGLKSVVINHRLSMPMSEEENRHFNPIRFSDQDGNLLYSLPARESREIFKNKTGPMIGKAYYSKGMLVEEPMDFTFKNRLGLADLHGILQRIVFPEYFSKAERFNITETDRNLILKYMSMLPGESASPVYSLPDYYDSYSKFFKFGTDQSPIPKKFRIFNKTGNAYGHVLDGSYIVDFEAGIEFFVSAVIYTNANETLNDDQYEYDQIAFPFFAELGEYLYQMELKRKKDHQPDLTEFMFKY